MSQSDGHISFRRGSGGTIQPSSEKINLGRSLLFLQGPVYAAGIRVPAKCTHDRISFLHDGLGEDPPCRGVCLWRKYISVEVYFSCMGPGCIHWQVPDFLYSVSRTPARKVYFDRYVSSPEPLSCPVDRISFRRDTAPVGPGRNACDQPRRCGQLNISWQSTTLGVDHLLWWRARATPLQKMYKLHIHDLQGPGRRRHRRGNRRGTRRRCRQLSHDDEATPRSNPNC
jgi:hypothetical protein